MDGISFDIFLLSSCIWNIDSDYLTDITVFQAYGVVAYGNIMAAIYSDKTLTVTWNI